MRSFKHLSLNDRLKIEALLQAGKKPKDIAEIIRVHVSTVYRELKRGRYERLDYRTWKKQEMYSPDIAHNQYRDHLSAKGAPLKISRDHRLAAHIEAKILREKYSPSAVLGEIRAGEMKFDTEICVSTLYSYIDKGVFLKLTNKHLPVRGTRKRAYRHIRQARVTRGDSIEKRPEEVAAGNTFGHWEMDTVIGKKAESQSLLVLTERLTRRELIIPMPDRTAAGTVKALDRLERKYGKLFPKLFRSITVDNGKEFSDAEGLERSKYRKGKRTKLYYCPPLQQLGAGLQREPEPADPQVYIQRNQPEAGFRQPDPSCGGLDQPLSPEDPRLPLGGADVSGATGGAVGVRAGR